MRSHLSNLVHYQMTIVHSNINLIVDPLQLSISEELYIKLWTRLAYAVMLLFYFRKKRSGS